MAGMGYARHIKAGEPEPAAPAKDVLRVYGMKFCPYVHRLKLVLAAKGVKHETINIYLASKPEWYISNKNPRGKVPTIERNGVILYESDITSNYIDEVYPGRKLTTADPLKRAQELIVLGDFGTAISGFYTLVKNLDEESNASALVKIRNALSKVEAFLSCHGSPYICGNQPGMTDYMVWAHLERIGINAPSTIKGFPIQAYVDRMEEDPAVKACRHPNELHKRFFKGYATGNYEYEIGTVE